MKRQLIIFLALLPLLLAAQVGDLPRSAPAAEGVSTQAVIVMMDSLLALPDCEIHHVMVVRHGRVIAEMHPAPFRAEDAHTLYSASKTFTSLAVGIAIDENLLRLDDRARPAHDGLGRGPRLDHAQQQHRLGQGLACQARR